MMMSRSLTKKAMLIGNHPWSRLNRREACFLWKHLYRKLPQRATPGQVPSSDHTQRAIVMACVANSGVIDLSAYTLRRLMRTTVPTANIPVPSSKIELVSGTPGTSPLDACPVKVIPGLPANCASEVVVPRAKV